MNSENFDKKDKMWPKEVSKDEYEAFLKRIASSITSGYIRPETGSLTKQDFLKGFIYVNNSS